MARVFGLAGVLWQTGYTKGISDYAQNPSKQEAVIIKNVIYATNGTRKLPRDTKEQKKVQRVATRIVSRAMDFCDDKLEATTQKIVDEEKLISEMRRQAFRLKSPQKAAQAAQASPKEEAPKVAAKAVGASPAPASSAKTTPAAAPTSATATSAASTTASKPAPAPAPAPAPVPLTVAELDAKIKQSLKKIKELQVEKEKWEAAVGRLTGNWEFIVTDSKVPNAFVTDICPRKIFVNEGLLTSVHPTDDELALILGHEVSHVIAHHTDTRAQLKRFLTTFQLVLLVMIDPTGVFSFVVDLLESQVFKYIEASHMRSEESEADELGIQITAAACFDTQKASEIFGKLASLEEKIKSDLGIFGTQSSWNSSHPITEERYRHMYELSAVHNASKVSGCWMYRNAFAQLFTPRD
jgi:predicted Zn-dependent protease